MRQSEGNPRLERVRSLLDRSRPRDSFGDPGDLLSSKPGTSALNAKVERGDDVVAEARRKASQSAGEE
jgi:hypothetical protein